LIEKDVLLYLQGVSSLVSLLGNKMYIIQAPQTGVQMPWLVIENTSGSRKQITQAKVEEIAYLRITVDAGPTQYKAARDMIEIAKNAIENYRGVFQTADDCHITCGSIRGWAGIGGAYRYQFDVTAKFTETLVKP
jgi:hypothetical protein